MRRIWAVCVALAAAACSRESARVGPPDVAILYSADLRGAVEAPSGKAGGLARRATLVDRARLEARAVVQVDAGDFAPAGEDEPSLADPAARAERAARALRAYQRMGVDAITVGERDLALGPAVLRALCDEARIPVVSANIVGSDGRPLFPAQRIVRAGTETVGVFGVLDLGGGQVTVPAGVTLTDPVAAAKAAIATLRGQGARLIVGLFHVAGGLARAQAIADAAKGIDVVVLGHDGPAGAPRFVHAAARGVEVGRIDVHLGARRTPHIQDRLLATTPNVAEQLGVHLLLRVASAPVLATFDESMAARKKAGLGTFGEGWTYGSTALCIRCHETQAAQWKTTAHATAFATLEETDKAGEPACMGCHMTGFLLPGGPQNLETATTQFGNVGCESCHGPSGAHVQSRDKRGGTSRIVDPVICLGCHTPDQSEGFVPAARWKRIVGPGHGLPLNAAR
jgi:hypothetical protein